MTTTTTQISPTWVKVADPTDTELLITWDSPVPIQIATTSANVAPTGDGHIIRAPEPIKRASIGSGYVWAKVCAGVIPTQLPIMVSTGAGTGSSQGAVTDVRATWYDQAASLISSLKLLIATSVNAGSHVYGYSAGYLVTDSWTLFGVTRVKTYVWTNGVLSSESDWV
jgi:hypothetical protein